MNEARENEKASQVEETATVVECEVGLTADKTEVPDFSPAKKAKTFHNPLKFDKSLFNIVDAHGKINLFAISLPIFLQLIVNNVLGMVNTAMFANYDPDFVTATNASNRVLSLTLVIISIISSGLGIVLAHAMGRDDKHEVNHAPFNALFMGGIFSIFCVAILVIFAEPLLTMFHLEGAVMEMALIHLRANSFGTIFCGAIINIFTVILRCYGKTLVTVIVVIARVGLGVVTNALFINTPLGSYLPMIYNVIIVNYISGLIGVIVGFIEIKIRRIKIGHKVDFSICAKLFRVGLPSQVSNISYTLSSLLTASILTSIRADLLNVKVYIDTLLAFISFFSASLGQSSSVMVGRVVGAGDYEKANRMHYSYLVAIVLLNVSLSILMLIFHRPLYSIFDSSSQNLALILPVFAVDIFVEIGRALNHVEQYTLNGAGDVRYTTIISIVACWVCAVGGTYLFAIQLNMGILGCYVAAAIDELSRAFLYELRWRSGKWKFKKL